MAMAVSRNKQKSEDGGDSTVGMLKEKTQFWVSRVELSILVYVMVELQQELQSIKETLSLVTQMIPLVAELKEAFDAYKDDQEFTCTTPELEQTNAPGTSQLASAGRWAPGQRRPSAGSSKETLSFLGQGHHSKDGWTFPEATKSSTRQEQKRLHPYQGSPTGRERGRQQPWGSPVHWKSHGFQRLTKSFQKDYETSLGSL
ncbi:hypothetical protein EGW08_009357 [Elysia chlorotica]|uniref:Uncharacterized protein n=1 Tax=Elysia chlorotica TaxID=188477 RepID=A0A3S0ZPS7_ELYCH|nr:hypothetical protein EGW08_009357 [Elysia chlorotica]